VVPLLALLAATFDLTDRQGEASGLEAPPQKEN
jgi:hypothetical protein